MYQHLHIYIDLNWESYFDDENNYLKRFSKIINLAYSHHCTVYAFREDIALFQQNCQYLDENFSESIGNKLELLLENAILINKDSNVFNINYQNDQSTLIHHDRIAISSRSKDFPISLVSLSQQRKIDYLLAVNSSTSFFSFQVDIINTHEHIIEWISKVGISRNFHYSAKHGQNNVGNWSNASPLHCSLERAQELLYSAIADFNSRKQFFNFDEEYNTFIEFYYEGDIPQSQFHGFHIKPTQWNSRIPNFILKHFDKG